MGSSVSAYVGAYLEVPQAKVKVNQKGRRCSDSSCPMHKPKKDPKGNYCQVCGAKCENYEYQIESYMDSDVYSYTPEGEISPLANVPNANNLIISDTTHKGYVSRVCSFDDDVYFSNISIEAINFAIAQFTELSSKFREAFKDKYGVELEIKFGMITYWS